MTHAPATLPNLVGFAIAYARRGWAVFPLHTALGSGRCSCGSKCKKPGKHPRTQHGLTDATTDEKQIRAWWDWWPDAGVAIATGKRSGLLVVDIDPRNGGDKTWGALVGEHGMPPASPVVTTGSGGSHYYLSAPDYPVASKADGLGKGVDVKCNGGYVCAPPSMHDSGERYTWNPGGSPRDVEPSPAPAWILDKLGRQRGGTGRGAKGNTRGDPPDSKLASAFAHADMLGRRLDDGRWLCRCPWSAEHTSGRDFDGSTVLLPATSEHPRARWHCSHAHCSGRTTANALAALPKPAVEAAEREWVPRADATTTAESPADDDDPEPEMPAGHHGGDLPIIQITTDLPRVVDQAAAALAADKSIFQRNGYLVRVVRVAEDEADAQAAVGTPQIREMPPATLRERLCDVATWTRYMAQGDKWVATLPSSAVVQALAERAAWRGIRPLSGLIETPSLQPNGATIVEPGYNTSTGFLYVPECEYPAVAEQPTQAQACDALAALCEVWCDFPFASEASRYAPIAAVLSLVGRPAILGPLPALVTDANCPGTGKTLCNDAIVLIATGRRPAKMTCPPDELEMEKVLGSYAIRGASVVAFDNLAGPFCGAPLDKVLTAWPTVDLRVLGKSEVPTLRWNAMVLATGNGVEVRGDTTRRVLVCRLESPEENPEERARADFAHPDLLDWTERERPRLVAAALTILRGYCAANRPDVGVRPWGSFEAWSALVPSSILWAGGANVLDARATVAADEPEDKRALRVILEQWPRLAPDGITLRSAITALYPRERLRGEAAPDGFDELREALEILSPPRPNAPPSTHRLGNAMRKLRRRVVAGRCIITAEDSHTKTQVWKILTTM